AVALHPQVKNRLADIDKIVLTTHDSAIRIISKTGALANPADRDHCLQYMTAVPLIFGALSAEHYEDSFHVANPLIDELRSKMQVKENPEYSADYYDPEKRSIANAVQVFFTDGSATDNVAVEYPVGHRRRREEGMPLLIDKFKHHLATRFAKDRCHKIAQLCSDQIALEQLPVHKFMDAWMI
ncbi:MAG: 2-methylcitrate dehydratase, partial [Halomonas sp.]